MSVTAREGSPPRVAAQEGTDQAEAQKMRCLCGKWWSYRSGDKLILRCKLCRREIVISGENLEISYR